MSASLVGSEMCIRDRSMQAAALALSPQPPRDPERSLGTAPETKQAAQPVSYTHLTLPTICSV
eukprot:3724783-Alexandrium_andersonii.AAC.1